MPPDLAARYPLDQSDMELWIRQHAALGQRILDIGCGGGSLIDRLADDFDVLGIDPRDAESANVGCGRFEDLDAAPFDVVFASVSLHHLDDADDAVRALRRLTRPGTIMLVREFDRVALDHEPTLRFWYDRRRHSDHDHSDPADHPLPATFEEFVDEWREFMEHHVSTWDAVLAMLHTAGFETTSVEPTAYLFRWGLDESVRPEEERLAREGSIRLVGRRWGGYRPE